jgi:two-component system OmpR family sensor kinase
MRPRSLRARLTLWYTSLLTITMLVLGGAAYGLLVYNSTRDMDASLRSVAKVLAEQAAREEPGWSSPNVDALFRRFFGVSPWDRYFEMRELFDRRRPLHRSGTDQLPLSEQALRNARSGRPTLETIAGLGKYPARVLTQPVVVGGRVTRLIQVGLSMQSLYTTRRRFLLITAGVLPLGLLLAGGGGWLLARRALAPVDRMTLAARRISAERLTERLEETGIGDELDRLAVTLNAMLGRLDDAFRQIRQFSADASHELQTPLTILKGELEVALRHTRTPQEYQQTLRSALEETDRIAVLVDGLLLLSRADAGVLRMDRRPVDLAQLLLEVHIQAKVLAAAKRLSLELEPPEPLVMPGDHDRLRRMVLNLVENAIKYTPEGGRLSLTLERRQGWALLYVSDTGIGIAPEEQERIFQRFYRAEDIRVHGPEGSGLGLCIARSIAEAHGGRILVDSTPGRGSTFTVHLPLTP